MNPFDILRDWFIWITDLLVDAAMDCYRSPILPDFLGDIFNDMSDWTAHSAGELWDLANWYDDVVDAIEDILSWASIKQLIKDWLKGIESLIAWFSTWVDKVQDVIGEWWEGVADTVKGWIDVVGDVVDDLKADWDNFWVNIFPTLVSFTWLGTWWNSRVKDVQALIDSAFDLRKGFWEGWQELRDTVISFFADPLEFLWGKFADWFLGPEG